MLLSPTELSTKFPSLQPFLAKSPPLLGIFFSASWCPDCTPVTLVLNDLFVNDQPQEEEKKVFELVYVSSDRDAEQMKKYVPSPKWGVVPFEHVDERADLKRHFGACAGKETAGLGMKAEDRKSGLPTLIVLDSKTGNILTRDGVEDIMGDDDTHDAKEALQKWIAML